MTLSTSNLRALDERLARIEERLERITALAEQAPAAIATAVDVADEWAMERGDVDERVRGVAALLDKLSEPKTLAALERLVDLAVTAPDLVAVMADIADETMAKANDDGVDVARLVESLGQLATLGGRMVTNPSALALLEQTANTPEVLRLAHATTVAAAEAAHSDEKVGAFGLLRALGEPRVQRATGAAIAFARAFGEQLESDQLPRLGAAKESGK